MDWLRHRVAPDELHDQRSQRRGRVRVEAGRRRCACDRPGNEGRYWDCRRPMRARRTGRLDARGRARVHSGRYARREPRPGRPFRWTSAQEHIAAPPSPGLPDDGDPRGGESPAGVRTERASGVPVATEMERLSGGQQGPRSDEAPRGSAREGRTDHYGQATAVGTGSRPGATKGRGTRDGPTYPAHVELQRSTGPIRSARETTHAMPGPSCHEHSG